MKVLIACDSFKGSLMSTDVNKAIQAGLESTLQERVQCQTINISDGGEGFLDAIRNDGRIFKSVLVSTVNQINEPIMVEVLISGKTCFVESATVIGLNLIDQSKRNIMKLSSYGLGLLVKKVHEEQDISNFYIGLGGTGVNDYGLGFACALGAIFKNVNGKNLNYPLLPCDLNLIASYDAQPLSARFSELNITFVSDVHSTVTGSTGAALMFSRQKNAQHDETLALEASAMHLLQIIKNESNIDLSQCACLAAAGGIGLLIKALLLNRIKFIDGAEFVFSAMNVEQKIGESNLVITGEGMIDGQTFCGKVVGLMIGKCQQLNTDLIVIAGDNALSLSEQNEIGKQKNVLGIYALVNHLIKKEYYINSDNARQLLFNCSRRVGLLLKKGKMV